MSDGEPGEPASSLLETRRESLEEWLIHPDNVRRLGFYIGGSVLVVALAWATTFLGASRWLPVAALAMLLAGFVVALATRSWRRATVVDAVAIGLLAVATAIWMTLGAFGIGPSASLLAAGKLAPGDHIVVRDFTGDTALGRSVATAFRVSLAGSPSIHVTDSASANVRASVEGEVRKTGDELEVTVRLLRGRDRGPLVTLRDDVSGPDALIPAVDGLARALRRRIGDPIGAVRATPPLVDVLTPSLEALVLYAAADAAGARGRADQAIPMLRNAIALDSSFALARLTLADALRLAGASRAALDSALEGAFAHRDRLTEASRLRLDAAYFTWSAHRDRARAIAALERVLARGDTTPATLDALAALLVQRRAYQRAESLSARAVAMAPEAAAFVDTYLDALAAQSRMTRVEAVVEDFCRRQPGDAYAAVASISLPYANLDYDAALAVAERLLTSPDTAAHEYARGFVARLELLHGRVAAYQRAIRDTARAGTPEQALADSALLSRLDAWYLGRNELAVQRLDSSVAALAPQAMPGEDLWLQVARIYAMAGRPDRAREIVSRITASPDTALARRSPPDLHRTLGEIALAEGRPKLAIVEFYRADSLPDGPAGDPLQTMVDLGRAFNDANEPDSAIVWLERFVNAPRWRRDAIDAIYLPRVHELLAELYDTRGDGPRAISHYGPFANLWRNADRELLPTVTSARERLAELTRERQP